MQHKVYGWLEIKILTSLLDHSIILASKNGSALDFQSFTLLLALEQRKINEKDLSQCLCFMYFSLPNYEEDVTQFLLE